MRRPEPDINPHYLTVVCHYCGSQPGEPCRQTMLDNLPVTRTHKARQDYAETVEF